MNCSDWRLDISAFLDGNLELSRSDALEQHSPAQLFQVLLRTVAMYGLEIDVKKCLFLDIYFQRTTYRIWIIIK